MKRINVTEEINENGKHKVIEFKNGVKVKLLKEPSDLYRKKMKARAVEEKIKHDAEELKLSQERLIKQRMKNNAIKELIKEGALPESYGEKT